MKLRWMPLDVADYRADTAHLSALEHGVYLLLIMHYWQTGSLPDDDAQLARITCTGRRSWATARPVVEKFFLPGWKHKRIEQEIEKAKEVSKKRRGAALIMHEDRHTSASASAEQVHTPLPIHLHKQREDKILNGVAKSWTPPRHGATSQRTGRVYVQSGTPEWASYADDFKSHTGVDPVPNEHGGKWFKTLGAAS